MEWSVNSQPYCGRGGKKNLGTEGYNQCCEMLSLVQDITAVCTHETTGRIVTVTGPEKDQHRKQQPHCSMCGCIHLTQNLC